MAYFVLEFSSCWKGHLKAIPLCLMWWLWREINAHYFEGKEFNLCEPCLYLEKLFSPPGEPPHLSTIPLVKWYLLKLAKSALSQFLSANPSLLTAFKQKKQMKTHVTSSYLFPFLSLYDLHWVPTGFPSVFVQISDVPIYFSYFPLDRCFPSPYW